MNYFVMAFAMFLGAVLQASLPALGWMAHARIPFMVGIVVYYALLHTRGTMLVAAFAAGLLDDSLGLMPLGYSTFAYIVVGLACQSYRDVVIPRQWTTQAVFGASANAGALFLNFALLAKDDLISVGFLNFLLRLIVAAISGFIAIPLIFMFIDWLNRNVGITEWEEA